MTVNKNLKIVRVAQYKTNTQFYFFPASTLHCNHHERGKIIIRKNMAIPENYVDGPVRKGLTLHFNADT